MNHPDVLLLPVMMFADYYLTLWGAVERERKYGEHFSVTHYELNPVWQQAIARRRWFNPRHAVLTLVLSGILFWLVEHGNLPWGFARGALGALLVLYAMVLGRHLNNLLIFRHIARVSDQISGSVSMSQEFALHLSLFQTLMVLAPVAVIAGLTQSPFAQGGVLGIVLLVILHLVWIARIRKAAKRTGPPPLNPVPTRRG